MPDESLEITTAEPAKTLRAGETPALPDALAPAAKADDPEVVYLEAQGGRARLLCLTPDAIVADVVDTWPAALPILAELGFKPLQNPLLRRTLARTVTLSQACALLGIDPELVMERLRTVAR